VTNAEGGEAVAEFVPRTIAERVSALGGALAIDTGNGQTVVTLTLPTANDL
jgi:signal transduction histidine kinase